MLRAKKLATHENAAYRTQRHSKAQDNNAANESTIEHSSKPPANNTLWQQLAMPIQRKCESCEVESNQVQGSGTSTKQPNGNLLVGRPNDKYEQEADSVADKVMRTKDSDLSQQPVTGISQSMSIQRKCPQCEESEESLEVQRKETGGGSVAPASVNNVLNSSGQALDASVKSFMEPRFGVDFSGVRVHTNTQAAESAKSINAKAFTSGNNIVFNTGQYEPDTGVGKKLLAHELTHTIQQDAMNSAIQRTLYTCERDEDCGPRESEETSWADGYGMKADYITSPENGFLVWGFPISSTDTSALDSLPNWGSFLGDMMTRDATWRVRGFSDCLGEDALNT